MSGDANLVITGIGRFEKLNSAYDSVIKENVRLQDALRKVEQQSGRVDKSQEAMANAMTKRVAQMVTGYMGLSKAIELANRAFEKQLELQQRAGNLTTSLADAQAQLNNQMSPNATLAQFRQMAAMGQAAGVRTGLGEAMGVQMLAKIVGSTSGGWTPDRMQAAVQMMEAGAPLFRGPQVSELGRFGGAALAMQRGIPGLSAQQAIGMLGAGLGQSVVESISEIQNLVPPAITAQQRFKKVDPLTASIEGLAIGGAISQRLFDPTGQRSAYAASALISTIAEQAPELLNRGLSPMQVLDELQKPENKALQRRVQENLQGYLISKASQYEFTTGDVSSIMAKEMIPQMRPGPQDVQNWIDRASIGTPEIQTATQLRQAGARQEAAIRTMGGPTEAVRRFLFGGETDEGRYAPGELAGLTRGTGLLGFADSAANLMRKGAFEAALLAGASPLEAGQYILDMLDTTRDPERGKQIEDARRAMAQLPQILTETQRANEEFAKQTERAQNGAAAAAQRHAHAE